MSGTLLDVGCGDGSTAIHRGWPLDFEYHGVDIDSDCVARARDRGLSVTQADVDQGLPFPDNTFTRVVCKAVLEHVDHPKGVVSECRRVLADGGVLLTLVPSDRSYDVWGDYTHLRAFRRDALADLLADGGFDRASVTISPYHPLDTVGMAVKSVARIVAPWTPYGYPRAWEARAVVA